MSTLKMKYAHVVLIFVILLTGICSAQGQNSSQYDKGTPPQHAAGVSPLGSYTSADLGTINLSNGALNISLSLASVGGRGFSLPLNLSYSSKVWSASRESNFADENGYHPVAYAKYADIENVMDIYSRVAPGWTIGAAPTLIMRGNGIKNNPTSPCVGDFRFALTKLSVMLPDKGEIQLRDDATDGAPLTAQSDPSTQCSARDGNRGQRWHASDGSGIVFISDTANGIVRGDLNGVLILSDGTRYRFSSLFNPAAGSPPLNLMSTTKILARGTSITDRNGNQITIAYPAANEVRYTDQLGRITKIQKNVLDPDNSSITLAVLVTVPGYQGQNRYFKIKSAVMNQRYRPGINPTLPVINGDYDPMGWGFGWGTATRLFPKSFGADAERIDQMTVLSDFILPDGRTMEFYYNEFGEVAEVRLPTGGKMQYDYQYVSSLPAGKSHIGETQTLIFESDVSDVDRSVVARRTYADGSNLEGSWAYSYTGATAQVTASAASGAVLRNEKHYFMASGRYLNSPSGTGPVPDRGVEGTGNTLWSTGVESRTEMLDAAGTTVLAASEQDWTQRASLNWAASTTYAQEQPANDNRVNQSRRYLETGAMAKVETFYDQYNNSTEVKEYDYDQTLKRRTVTSYLSWNNGFNYQTDDSIHLLRLPETQTVYDANGNQKAQSVTEYDAYTNDGNRDVLTGYPSLSQHDSTYGTTKTTRGNPTRVATWLNTTSSYIYSYPRYDVVGNVVSIKDPRGNVSTVSFADDFGDGSNPGTPTQNPGTPTYALPTLFTSPPPSAGAPVHTARSQYDYSTGLLTGFRDRNNIVSQTIYNDPFNRPTQVKSALGITNVETHTTNYYAPATVFGITLAKNDVLTASDLNTVDDASIRSWTVTDGFGRTTEVWKRDPAGDVKVVTIYDGLGRAKQASNPFRPSLGETAVYTTTTYDLLGRTTSVSTPDGAVVTTSYSADTVTVTDQAGKARKSVTDALGRLIKVFEDPSGLNYETTYDYDTLDNLVKVTQGTQQRFFMYDSLKRLIRARNPEQGTRTSLGLSDPNTGNSAWSIGYEYDAAGNLTKRTDARGVDSTYAYDALGRNTTVDYSDTTSIVPDVKRFYDGATRGIGRLWYSSKGDETAANNVEKTSVDSYDALGRPLAQQQSFKLNNVWKSYSISRTYNLAGGVNTQTYPSNRSVTYSYDSAGRATSFSGTLGGDPRTYATGITYSSWGSLTREQFGTNTPLYHKSFYNIRGQLFDTRLSSVNDTWDWNRGRLILYYSSNHQWGQSGTDNNGNVRFAETWIPPENATLDQADTLFEDTYSYDSLNRLTSVAEQKMSVATGWGTWHQQFCQQYTYDRYGNRTIDAAQTWGTGINNKQFSVDTATNRLGVPSGQTGTMSYDDAGNLITDTYTGAGAREYDAENKMTRAWGGNNQWQEYTYNADGQRTRRKVDGQETWQIYGMDGELLAEYAADGSPSSPQKEYGYRNGQLLVTAEPSSSPTPSPTPWNVALASNGATVTSSSTFSPYVAGNVIDGSRKAVNNTLWLDNTYSSFGDWVEVSFNGSKTIGEIDVITQQDDPNNLVEPTLAQTFSLYGITAYDVQYWNGSAWATVSGGSVTGNNKVWRQFTFTPVTTTKIRVVVNGGADNAYSRVVEVEAWTTNSSPSLTNYAKATNGGSVLASSTLSPYVAGNVIDGSRKAVNNTLWLDNTYNSFGDWIEVSFNGSKTISEIDVITQQDDPNNLVEPTLTQTFSLYGITAYDVQYWNGSAWTTVSGGSVTGNNKVWRQFTFTPVTTTKIRVVVNGGADNAYSRVVEVEAWGETPPTTTTRINWLVTDHLGTPRMIIDQTGTLANLKRHDYLPFGEELFAGTGGRSTALGYTGGDGVRQQFTQKERDNETGLDYFEARYYSSSQGRFSGVDRYDINVERQSIADDNEAEQTFASYISQPQHWNRYAYAINNPLKYIDPLGEAIELTGTEEERKKQLEELQKAVGKKAGTYLYENKGSDGKYYVGIYTNGPDGKGPAFEKLNSVAGEIAPIINDTKVVGLSVVANGTTITNDAGQSITIGTIPDGRTPGVTTQVGGKLMIYFLDSKTNPGKIPGILMQGTNGKDGIIYPGEILAHELGHARAFMTGDPNNDGASLRIQNKVRALYEPKKAIKSTRWTH